MTQKTPIISICIPTYNGEKYLQKALDSIKVQTYQNIEVIISDDQSKDNTREICKKFQKSVNFPVHIYTHISNGIGSNWNHCIEKANGEYIQFLFQDDILAPLCLEKKLDYLLKNNLKTVCSKRTIISSNGNYINSGTWYESFHDLQKLYLGLHIPVFYILTKKDLKKLDFKNAIANIFGEPITFLFEVKMMRKIGKFSNTSKQILDAEYGYRILKKHPIGIIHEPLCSFRLHEEQASSLNSKFPNSLHQEFNSFVRFLVSEFFWELSFDFKKDYYRNKYPNLYRKLINLRYLISNKNT